VSPDQIDRLTPEVGGGEATNTERQTVLSDTESLRRIQKTRRPPGYLGEYYCGRVEGGPFSTAIQRSKPMRGRGPLDNTQHLFLSNTQSVRVAEERLQVPDSGQNSAQTRQTAQALRQQTKTLTACLENRINEEVKRIDEEVEQLLHSLQHLKQRVLQTG